MRCGIWKNSFDIYRLCVIYNTCIIHMPCVVYNQKRPLSARCLLHLDRLFDHSHLHVILRRSRVADRLGVAVRKRAQAAIVGQAKRGRVDEVGGRGPDGGEHSKRGFGVWVGYAGAGAAARGEGC